MKNEDKSGRSWHALPSASTHASPSKQIRAHLAHLLHGEHHACWGGAVAPGHLGVGHAMEPGAIHCRAAGGIGRDARPAQSAVFNGEPERIDRRGCWRGSQQGDSESNGFHGVVARWCNRCPLAAGQCGVAPLAPPADLGGSGAAQRPGPRRAATAWAGQWLACAGSGLRLLGNASSSASVQER